VTRRRSRHWFVFASCLLATLSCQSSPHEQLPAPPSTPEPVIELGTLTKIRGDRGLRSPDLPDGLHFGEGARITAGQALETPRGTRAELTLDDGVRLRLDEDSLLTLSTDGFTLARGRLVVLTDAREHPLVVHTPDAGLAIEQGEVEVHASATTGHFGVIHGHATLRVGERDIPLGPGASIATPLPERASVVEPELSLRPLHESAWSAAFDDSELLADTLTPGVGSLVARRAGSQVERQSLRLTEQKVDVTIVGRIARTEVEQAFFNDSSVTLEGIFRFPLPADASISDLQLLVGDTWVRGEMVEKQRARAIFRSIVDATVPRDPALLEWERGSEFKLDIFPIPGHGERRIKLAYTQVLPEAGDTLRYRYPMGGGRATATEIGDFEFNLTIDGRPLVASAPDPEAELQQLLANLRTPMIELAAETAGALASLHLREREYQPRHELGVDIPLRAAEHRVDVATHHDKDGQGYFMLTLRPELELAAAPKPLHVAIVLDRSHGTTPALWAAANGLVLATMASLGAEDRVTVLACDTACDQLEGGLIDQQLAAYRYPDFFAAQTLAGASDLGAMLSQADAALDSEALDSEALEAERVIVYLGDGAPSSGALTAAELGGLVERELDGVRLLAVALGARADLLVLEHLTALTGGELLPADAGDDLDGLARELALRAHVPVARALALELPDGLVDVHPRQLPSLRPGDALTLVGKLAPGVSEIRGDIRLRGAGPHQAIDERFQIAMASELAATSSVHAHLPRTWAQREIQQLTATRGAEAQSEIIALSRRYNVMSQHTALLVLENDQMFAEFGVARRADDTDSWDGSFDADSREDRPRPAAVTKTTKSSSRSRAAEPDVDCLLDPNLRKCRGGPKEEQYFTPVPVEPERPRPVIKERKAADKIKLDDDWDALDCLLSASHCGATSMRRRPRGRLVLGSVADPSREHDRVVELLARRDEDPGNRKAHRDLVRAATIADHPDALAFARSWAQADPDHAPALLAHADQLARAGDPLALRHYASVVEVAPFIRSEHARLASAYAAVGDFARACSHRRALVSIDPMMTAYHLALIDCLAQADQVEQAHAAMTTARATVGDCLGSKADRVERAIDEPAPPKPAPLHPNADLRVELRWHEPEDLDVAVIDGRGRRASVLHPVDVRVRPNQWGLEQVELLTVQRVRGSVYVEVTRPQSPDAQPLSASLSIQTSEGSRRRFDLVLLPGTQRVALAHSRW
jgi:hypothetical protein